MLKIKCCTWFENKTKHSHREPGNYSVNPDLLKSNSIQDITKNLWGFVWLNDELALLSAAATLRCIFDSFWRAFYWLNCDVCGLYSWQCRWMMTWGNGLEEHREIVGWKMSICAWRSFGTSPSAGCCQGRDQNKRGAGVPAPSCLFTPQLAASTRQERLGHRRRAKTCLSVRVKEHGVKKLKKSPEPAENCYRGVLEPTHTHTHTHGETGEDTHSCTS